MSVAPGFDNGLFSGGDQGLQVIQEISQLVIGGAVEDDEVTVLELDHVAVAPVVEADLVEGGDIAGNGGAGVIIEQVLAEGLIEHGGYDQLVLPCHGGDADHQIAQSEVCGADGVLESAAVVHHLGEAQTLEQSNVAVVLSGGAVHHDGVFTAALVLGGDDGGAG